MKRKIISIIAAAVLGMAGIADAAPDSNSIVQDGIEYYIQTDKSIYNLGENVQMLFRVTNLRTENVIIGCSRSPEFNLLVQKDGETIWKKYEGWYWFSPGVELLAGESEEIVHSWDMKDYNGNPVEPGMYDVVGVMYNEPWNHYTHGGSYTVTKVASTITILPRLSTTYYVDSLGSDDNDGLSPQTAFATIQKAINSAFDGDTVIVADGTYTGSGNRNIDFLGKAITVRSESGPESCVIDCNGTQEDRHRGFYFHNGEDASSILDGFTITGGYAKYGGAIFCEFNNSPTITNCIINGNLAVGRSGESSYGGGISCNYKSKPTITNCTISNNSAWYGGGIICDRDSNAVISNCTISNNSARYLGGGISCLESSPTITNCIINNNLKTDGSWGGGGGISCGGFKASPIITGCTISDNMSSAEGGGIYCEESNPTISKCTINGNSAAYGNGGGIYCQDSSPIITNCIITSNTAGAGGGISCDVRGSTTINNCIISDNSAEYGGGIYSIDSNPMITDCTIIGNTSYCGGGIIFDFSIDAILTNCTITNNTGGGIYCDLSSLTITNCTISGNSGGGGMTNFESIPMLINCIFTGNMGDTAGGMSNSYSNPTLINCIFTGNVGATGGGMNNGRSSPMMTNCIFTGNVADTGGAMNNWDSNPTLTNCTFAENSAFNGNALAFDSYLQQYPSNIQVTNSILADGGNEIWNNDNSTIAITYSDVQGGYEGKGNIDAIPRFVEPGYWDVNDTPDDVNDDFWVEGDYHLLPTSPCMDAGDPNYIAEPNETDLDGNPRVRGDAIDMGAYETIIHEARLLVLPRVINQKSKQPRIMAWVRLPQGITKDQVDSDEPLILYPGGIEAMRQFVFDNRRRGTQRVSIFAFFDKAELMDAIPANGRVELQVLGHLRQPGQYFSGTDTIRIIPRRSKPQLRHRH
ncbi:MAG: right-handed parallel beta-helix repeat-containing protein [Planctomycetota bacterium]|jgi:parallel beta-helix repeat protein